MIRENPPRISRCARCGKSIRATTDNSWRPFCSERCKTVDLGDWFSERNYIPGKEESEETGDGTGE